MNYEIFGWLGAVFFGVCAIPQAYQSWKNKHSNGINSIFITLWFLGEVSQLIFSIYLCSYPLITNVVLNTFFLLIIIWYKIKPSQL